MKWIRDLVSTNSHKEKKIFARLNISKNEISVGEKLQLSLDVRLPGVAWQVRPLKEGHYILFSKNEIGLILFSQDKQTHILGDLAEQSLGKLSSASEEHFFYEKILPHLKDFKISELKNNELKLNIQKKLRILYKNKVFDEKKSKEQNFQLLWDQFVKQIQDRLPAFTISNVQFLELKQTKINKKYNSKGISIGSWIIQVYKPGKIYLPVPELWDITDSKSPIQIVIKTQKVLVKSPFGQNEKPKLQKIFSYYEQTNWYFVWIIILLFVIGIVIVLLILRNQKKVTPVITEKIAPQKKFLHNIKEIQELLEDDFNSEKIATMLSYAFRGYIEVQLGIVALEMDTQTLLYALDQEPLIKDLSETGRKQALDLFALKNLLSELDQIKFAKRNFLKNDFIDAIELMKLWVFAIERKKELKAL